MQQDSDVVILLDNPRVTADLGRLTVGDFLTFVTNNQYYFTMLSKCIIEDLNTVPLDYFPAISQRFSDEYQKLINDMGTIRELMNYAAQ